MYNQKEENKISKRIIYYKIFTSGRLFSDNCICKKAGTKKYKVTILNNMMKYYKNFFKFACLSSRECAGFIFIFNCCMRSNIFSDGPTFIPVKFIIWSFVNVSRAFPSIF